MNENNKVFELSDKDLAKVVGGQTDRNNETENPVVLNTIIVNDENAAPAIVADCGLKLLGSSPRCKREAYERTTSYCPTCPYNY